ncbi:hypothetical protein [Maribellus mangrovi]|uniref:hypothetical protein n=1 Tax=Maribellus mangrovi TaxID=3133146 RepID=UPI0030EB4870
MLRFLSLIICLSSLYGYSQESKTYLSFEGGGTGIVASANIAKTVFTHERFKIILQGGLGWIPKLAQSSWPFNLPIQATANFGKHMFFIEAGAGSTFIFKSKIENPITGMQKSELYLSPIVGFRYESEKWFGRLYIGPLFNVTGPHLYDDVTSDFINFGIAVGTRLN